MKTKITPFIVGHGRSSQVIQQALAILNTQMPNVDIQPPIAIERGGTLKRATDGLSIAFLANPHGLHSERILEADRAGFHGIASEKPSCVSLEQCASLQEVKTKTAVYHGYRQLWGPQTLKEMIGNNEFGEVFAIEGRYWQASTAERAIIGPAPTSWKNNPQLSGHSDTLLDTGTHWADLAIFLAGEFPKEISGWASYTNAETPHRDSHIQLQMQFKNGIRVMSSISKNSHGSPNHFEATIFGSRATATWHFMNPDEILFGQGRERKVISRKTSTNGTCHPPYHGAGWLDGYVEITKQLLLDVIDGAPTTPYPTLRDNLQLIHGLLSANILRPQN